MDKVRIGVIGLGWFGEIHCDAIKAVPGLELAALCTRTEARLEDLGGKYGVANLSTDYNTLLADPEIDAVSVVTSVGPAHRTDPGGAGRGKARLPRKADGRLR